jgi:hypothetical protein
MSEQAPRTEVNDPSALAAELHQAHLDAQERARQEAIVKTWTDVTDTESLDSFNEYLKQRPVAQEQGDARQDEIFDATAAQQKHVRKQETKQNKHRNAKEKEFSMGELAVAARKAEAAGNADEAVRLKEKLYGRIGTFLAKAEESRSDRRAILQDKDGELIDMHTRMFNRLMNAADPDSKGTLAKVATGSEGPKKAVKTPEAPASKPDSEPSVKKPTEPVEEPTPDPEVLVAELIEGIDTGTHPADDSDIIDAEIVEDEKPATEPARPFDYGRDDPEIAPTDEELAAEAAATDEAEKPAPVAPVIPKPVSKRRNPDSGKMETQDPDTGEWFVDDEKPADATATEGDAIPAGTFDDTEPATATEPEAAPAPGADRTFDTKPAEPATEPAAEPTAPAPAAEPAPTLPVPPTRPKSKTRLGRFLKSDFVKTLTSKKFRSDHTKKQREINSDASHYDRSKMDGVVKPFALEAGSDLTAYDLKVMLKDAKRLKKSFPKEKTVKDHGEEKKVNEFTAGRERINQTIEYLESQIEQRRQAEKTAKADKKAEKEAKKLEKKSKKADE